MPKSTGITLHSGRRMAVTGGLLKGIGEPVVIIGLSTGLRYYYAEMTPSEARHYARLLMLYADGADGLAARTRTEERNQL